MNNFEEEEKVYIARTQAFYFTMKKKIGFSLPTCGHTDGLQQKKNLLEKSTY